MTNPLQPNDLSVGRRDTTLQGSLPTAGPQQKIHDPLGLNFVLESACEILRSSRIPEEPVAALLKIATPQLFSSGLPQHNLNPRALAALLAESPVVVTLLERLQGSTVLLGAHRKREEFNLLGCLYVYAEIAIRSPLVAAELVKLHSGDTSTGLHDVLDKLQTIYVDMASEPNSPVKYLLEGEFKDTNTMEASAITAGVLAPLLALSKQIIALPADQSRRQSILQRLWSIGSYVVQEKYETPKQLRDLQILGEGISEYVVTFLRELSAMPTRTPSQELAAPPARSGSQAKEDNVVGQVDLPSGQLRIPPVPDFIITEVPAPSAPVATRPATPSSVIQIPGIKKVSANAASPTPSKLSGVAEKVEPQKDPAQSDSSPQPGQIPGVAKKSHQQ